MFIIIIINFTITYIFSELLECEQNIMVISKVTEGLTLTYVMCAAKMCPNGPCQLCGKCKIKNL